MESKGLLSQSDVLGEAVLEKIKLLRALANFYIENPTAADAGDIVNQRTQILKTVKELETDYTNLQKKIKKEAPAEDIIPDKEKKLGDEKDYIAKFIRMTVPESEQRFWDPKHFTGSLLVFFVNGEIDASSLIEKKSEPFTEDDFGSVEDTAFPEEPMHRIRVVDEPKEIFTIVKSSMRSSFSIFYVLTKPGSVTIKIYNELKQPIQEFDRKYDKPGEYSIEWDGCNEFGNPLPGGTYYCQVQIGDAVSGLKAMQISN